MTSQSTDWNCARGARPTILLGLLGEGVGRSRTPAMHEAEGEVQGIRVVYRLLDTENLRQGPADIESILQTAELAGFNGLNVTHPYKQRILEFVHERSETVEKLNASNTVLFRDGRRIAHNTDYTGFAHAFQNNFKAEPKARVLLAGAGGAGAALAFSLVEAGVGELSVYDYDQDLAERLAARVRSFHGKAVVKAISDPADCEAGGFDGIINATPMGMAGYPGMAVSRTLLSQAAWAIEIVYFPLETEFLKTARELKLKTMSGVEMVIMQAVDAFQLFTGRKADATRMGQTFHALGDD